MSEIDLSGRKGTKAIRTTLNELNSQRQKLFFEGFDAKDLTRIQKNIADALESQKSKILESKKAEFEKLKSEIAELEG